MADFAQWAILEVGKIALSVYVDDCFAVEPESTCASAFDFICTFNEAIGLRMAPDKCSRPRSELTLLGAMITLADHYVEATPPARKAKDLVRDLRHVLQRGNLSPAQAAKLRGRLGWARSLLFGRFGRAHLAPFSARQYANIAGKGRCPMASPQLPPGGLL